MQHLVTCPWPRENPQQDWIDQYFSVEAWLNATIGPTNWSWAQGNTDSINILVTKPEYATLVKIHYAH